MKNFHKFYLSSSINAFSKSSLLSSLSYPKDCWFSYKRNLENSFYDLFSLALTL